MGYDNLGHNLISVIKETNKTELGGSEIQFGYRWNKRLNVSEHDGCVLFFFKWRTEVSQTSVQRISADRSLDQQHKAAQCEA